jgi:hypothetical protein
MLEPTILSATIFLLVMLMVYLWASQRNIAKTRPLTHQEYLWRLKQITGKSEYDIFQIAAKEKGWTEDWVEIHFRRYLEDQTLPIYVQRFIEDGKVYIEAYRPMRGNFFNKRVVLFFSLFSMFIIGGSFILSIYIFPRIIPFNAFDGKTISRLAWPHLYRARSFAENYKYEKACSELKRACELGECEYYKKYCLTINAGSNKN